MNKRIATMWADALRSGGYAQTRDVLCEPVAGQRAFSTFGVLCDLYRRETDDLLWYHSGKGKDEIARAFADSRYHVSSLPRSVRSWSGMQGGGKTAFRLEEMEFRRHSFQQISEFIEQNWEDL